MPNKSQTGDASLGANSIGGATNDPATGFIRTEQELKRQTPLIAPTAGKWTMPNGIMHLPDRRRRGGGGDVHPWKVTLSYDAGLDAWAAQMKGGFISTKKGDFDTGFLVPATNPYNDRTFNAVAANDIVYARVSTAQTIAFFCAPYAEDLSDWNPITDTNTRYPIARIIDEGEDSLVVHQFARSNLYTDTICWNGEAKFILRPF